MKNKLATTLALGMFLAPMAASAALVELVDNGDFESGVLGPWSTSALGTGTCPNANQDWNVSSASNTGCNQVAAPQGNFAAYVMNDGDTEGLTYRLFQNISIPTDVVSGLFSFDDSSSNQSDEGRGLSASFYDISGVTLLATLFSESTFSDNIEWETHSIDATSFLLANLGQTVRLEFDNTIPGIWTGPAGLGLDNVSLVVEVADVSAPATVAILGLGLLGLGFLRRKKIFV